VLLCTAWGCWPRSARAADEDAFRPVEERAILSATLELEAAREVIRQQSALLAKDVEVIGSLQAENGALRTAVSERAAENAALHQALAASEQKASTAVKLAAAADERSTRLEGQLKTARKWMWIGTGVGFAAGFVAGIVVGAKLTF
jgi:hypothetical protein